jgi:cell division protein FtsQ
VAAGLAVAALGVTGSAALHALRTASVFAVARVDVEGTRRVPEATVLEAAGLAPGTNLFTVDPEAVQDRLEALPGVRSARVLRRLPNRVSLVIEEREPYAVVNAAEAGELVWVDAEGQRVGSERRPGAFPLPILSGVEPPPADPDQPLPDRLHSGLALLRAIQRTGPRVVARISEADLGPADGPVLYTTDGVVVYLGPHEWEERLARLDGLVDELESRGERVELIDLRFRDQIVLRPRAVKPMEPGPHPVARRPSGSSDTVRR